MADIENSTETIMDSGTDLKSNFDTIKTLLNSIRAQGILNTSDVDKMLTGINTKLEKLNTEEDIDLIKIFLSELKQNLEERHGVLVSKFGAIESLFTNLLKNSKELPTSAEIKELFDIVATNLSVFSREVVSQKESLTDIALKIDAIRSDDTDKKDIIKNITLLKPDLERLNNGFDSIVISLNDNFKTIVKTISTIDKTEYLDKFSDSLSNIETLSNTVLSAIQVLDKKAEMVDDTLKNVLTKEDVASAGRQLVELTAQSEALNNSVTDLTQRYIVIDNLADKIDASVNIIAGLKSFLEEADNENTAKILDDVKILEEEVRKISSDTRFDEFKSSLESVLNNLTESSAVIDKNLSVSIDEIKNIIPEIKALDVNVNFDKIFDKFGELESGIKSHINETLDKSSLLNEANITRVLNDISSSADSLNNKIGVTQSVITGLCEKNFGEVFDGITEMKNIVSQIDENAVSANNAIFSSITDRLSEFESALRTSLDSQERTVTESTAAIADRVEDIKNISNVLEYKMDSAVVETGNTKRGVEELKTAIESVLALDFVNVVKDLRADLYASKQDMSNAFENAGHDLSDKLSNDLYSKYELLISKMDTVEDDIRKVQINSLAEYKPVLDKISESIVDVLSYVSEIKSSANEGFEGKLDEIAESVKDTSINYVEHIRDVVDVIRTQVVNDLKSISETNERQFEELRGEALDSRDRILKSLSGVSDAVSGGTSDIKNDIKYSYTKLLEVQDLCDELRGILTAEREDSSGKLGEIIKSAEDMRGDFETKIASVRTAMLDKISEFKSDLTGENTAGRAELKSSIDELTKQSTQGAKDILSTLREQLEKFEEENTSSRNSGLSKIEESFNTLQGQIDKLSTENSGSRTTALARILDNFVALKEFASALNDKYSVDMTEKVDELIGNIDSLRVVLDKVDENVDADMTRQLSIIESNFEALVSQMNILFEQSDKDLAQRINSEFASISDRMQELIAEKIEGYKYSIEETFDSLKQKAGEQTDYLQDRIANLNDVLKTIWEDQAKDNTKQIAGISDTLKKVLEENLKLSEIDYLGLKDRLNEFAEDIASDNKMLVGELKAQFDDITKYVDSVLGLQAQDISAKQDDLNELIGRRHDVSLRKFDDINTLIEEENEKLNALISDKHADAVREIAELRTISEEGKSVLNDLSSAMDKKLDVLKSLNTELSTNEISAIESFIDNLRDQLELQIQTVYAGKDYIVESVKKELKVVTGEVEKETDTVIAELIEQFDLMKQSNSDEISGLLVKLEDLVGGLLYNNIEDLKSYLDVKTDNSVLTAKFDNLKRELNSSIEEITTGVGKLLEAGSFSSAMSDFRLATEMFVNSAVDRMNDKIEAFINENIRTIADILSEDTKKVEEKLTLFDKKFADMIVDKFEEIKLLSNGYNSAFENIQRDINSIVTEFDNVKSGISSKLAELEKTLKLTSESTNSELRNLNSCFDNLRSQISSKSFDEAFQNSINKQIGNLENLVNEQMGYIEEINELCADSLPDVTELNTLVKGSLVKTLNEFTARYENEDVKGTLESGLKQLKTDIINQLLNVFNQISFVSEQEEILDFIQDKHDDLISVLSNIVPVTEKINNIKSDIKHINDKINSIISSEGDIDYIYSLQDLESDIANLRLVLNEMKKNAESQEFDELLNSTNDIYKLVESIKSELPTKSDFDSMAEDVVSISSRTNKLILSSEESYKMLQDNLQDFKLVINDLDERTRNFARESGMDKVNSKLNALNEMMQNGSKTNQVFNQVFEYLAEWVDGASVQINTIADKVETLDEIAQIKDILVGMKADAEDSTAETEMAEALGIIFDKQNKKMTSLEAKLDKLIVANTVGKKGGKSEVSKLEDTVNKFLVALDEKITNQEKRINTLETSLNNLVNAIEETDSEELIKKVGGMDRHIAKLSKSIDKIASYVVEK